MITVRDAGDSSILGFCLLVIDELAFRDSMRAVHRSALETVSAAPYFPLAKAARARMRRNAQRLSTPHASRSGEPKDTPRPRAWVELIASHPERRGTGMMRSLLDESDRLAREHGGRCIEAMTDSWNIPAARMFERNGYEIVRVTGEKLILSKPLGQPG